MGHHTAAAAGTALRVLNSPELRPPPVQAPTQRRTTATTPPAPHNNGLLDYVTSHVDEVVTHTRQIAPDAEPFPLDVEDLYHWYERNTIGAAEADRLYRDHLMERHALEHAIALGDFDAVRPHTCPTCGSWGLFWDNPGKRARCSDRDCRTEDGTASSFSLARLAAQKVQRTEMWRRDAT